MTVEISTIGRLRINAESAINVDSSAAITGFFDLPVVEKTATFAGTQDHLEPEVMQQYVHGYTDSKMVLGKRSNTLDFTTYLASTGFPRTGITGSTAGLSYEWPIIGPSSDPANSWALGGILQIVMGGSSRGTLQAAATATTAGSTKTSVNITAGHGTGLGAKARAFAVVLPSGKIEAREILAVTANVVIPKMAFSEVPGTAAAVYWATTFHLIENVGSNLSTLQAVLEGPEHSDNYVARGLQGTFGIDVSPAAIAKLTFKMAGGAWHRTTSSLGSPGLIPNFAPIVNMNSELVVAPVVTTASYSRTTVTATVTATAHGLTSTESIWVNAASDANSITGTAITPVVKVITVSDANTFTFVCLNAGAATGTISYTACQKRNLVVNGASTWQPGFANTPVTSPEGIASSNLVAWKRARGRAVTGTFQVYDDTGIDWQSYDTNRTDIAIYQQLGTTTAGIVLLSAPCAQISAVPSKVDSNGLYAQTVAWSGRNDIAGLTPTSDLERSALKIHVF
jgi:hypothetical protein